jgi:hypothetical protein
MPLELEECLWVETAPMAMPAMQFAFEESQKYKEGKFILEKVCMVCTGSLTGCWNCIVKRCRCGAGQSAERRILVSIV